MACRFNGSPSDSSTMERARVSLRNSSALVDARVAGTRAAAVCSSERKRSSSPATSRKPSSSDSSRGVPGKLLRDTSTREATRRVLPWDAFARKNPWRRAFATDRPAVGYRLSCGSAMRLPPTRREKKTEGLDRLRRIDQDCVGLTVVEHQNRIGIQEEAVFMSAPGRLSAHNRFDGKRSRIIADVMMASVSREDHVRIPARSVFRIDHRA